MVEPFDDGREGTAQLLGLYVGVVVDRNDPKQLGRVRFRIPGVMEPSSPWAWPLGTSGGGSRKRGLFAVPEKGAEVGIFFKQGDPAAPYYLTAQWGRGEVPDEAAKSPPDNRVLSTEDFCVELDESVGSRRMKLTNRRTGDHLTFDAETNSVQLVGTAEVRIEAVGALRLSGTQVFVNGRPVRPVGDPI